MNYEDEYQEKKDKELEGYEYHEDKDFKRIGFNKK